MSVDVISMSGARLDEAAPWISGIRALVLDMDGVLYRGDTVIPGVPEFISSLDAAGIGYAMATNNSTLTPRQYVAKLGRMGIQVPESSVVTSGVATATYLRGKYPRGTRVYVLGMDALQQAIFDDGYFQSADADVDVVVSGAHFELTYAHLRTACLCIRAGAAYVATNADTTFPSEAGLVPGSGAIVAALRAATSVDPLVVGKPSTALTESCLEILGVRSAEAAMVGDRLDTDILSGERAGLHTILVLTGVSTTEEVLATGITPDITLDTLVPLTRYFESVTNASRR